MSRNVAKFAWKRRGSGLTIQAIAIRAGDWIGKLAAADEF